MAGEVHLRNVRQLTTDGENAEAYFSFDGTRLIFQRNTAGGGCDQIYTLRPRHRSATPRMSNGQGRTTCSYYFPSGDRVLYASTHLHDAACPPPPDYSRGYVWPIYDGYDIFVPTRTAADHAAHRPRPATTRRRPSRRDGDRIVFTSLRDGDLDLYTMAPDGTDVRQITNEPRLRRRRVLLPRRQQDHLARALPGRGQEPERLPGAAARRLIRPTMLELYVANADGTRRAADHEQRRRQLRALLASVRSEGPVRSNMDDPAGRDFDIYMIGIDGSGLERITCDRRLRRLPDLQPRRQVAGVGVEPEHVARGEYELFIAEWVEEATP